MTSDYRPMDLSSCDDFQHSATSSRNEITGNRLGIGHLLLWIAATAVILAVFRPALVAPILHEQATPEFPQRMQRRHRLALIALPTIAPIWGVALAGVVLAGWRCVRRGPPFPAQPDIG
jgi:uncharacterized iron-regulated membrane protein